MRPDRGFLGVGGLSDAEIQALVDASVAGVLDGAPGALDTLNELAAALGDDANFAATLTTSLAGKQPLHATLTAIAALTTTAFGRSVLEAANAAALRSLAGIAVAGAMTQTYATADATLDNPTAAAVATTAAALASFGYAQAQANAIPVAINALRADHLDLAQFVNALVDKLQTAGIVV